MDVSIVAPSLAAEIKRMGERVEVLEVDRKMLRVVLAALVSAVEEQSDGLDPTAALVQAMRDARSWLAE